MKRKKLLIKILGITVILIMPVILFLLYTRGPIPLLKLIPYETQTKKTAFPQWINNDEICYVEFVFYVDEKALEQVAKGMSIYLMRQFITDIDIYREKVGRPETKKLIRRIARKDILSNNLSGTDWGFRVYDNGRKIFLYYYYNSGMLSDYRYITMDITGRNVKERVPKIFPFDISQDGSALYGIFVEKEPSLFAKIMLGVKRNPEPKRFIAECAIKNGRIKKLMDFSDENFHETRNAKIYDLKLVAGDKLVLSYEKDYNKPGIAKYIYLVDLNRNTPALVDKLTGTYYDDIPHYTNSGEYAHNPHSGYVITKDEKYLICGNVGIYKDENTSWAKIGGFYKEYPAISPDGAKIAFIDILTGRGELNSLLFVGKELRIMDSKDLISEARSHPIK